MIAELSAEKGGTQTKIFEFVLCGNELYYLYTTINHFECRLNSKNWVLTLFFFNSMQIQVNVGLYLTWRKIWAASNPKGDNLSQVTTGHRRQFATKCKMRQLATDNSAYFWRKFFWLLRKSCFKQCSQLFLTSFCNEELHSKKYSRRSLWRVVAFYFKWQVDACGEMSLMVSFRTAFSSKVSYSRATVIEEIRYLNINYSPGRHEHS